MSESALCRRIGPVLACLPGPILVSLLLVFPALANEAADYVGSNACRDCHEAEYEAWQGSHHDLAMQPANADTVLGDFDDVVFEHRGVKTRFFQRDGKYRVEAQGADGGQQEYEVSFTFGVTPLQQYLVGFPDGRYQALTVAWDTRPTEQGGQRWFHLYPDEDIPPGDELHWTAPAHNWNYACAECHSTRLRKHYDAAADTYQTTWSEIDVACEACHGPGRRHMDAANAAAQGGTDYPADHGLAVKLDGRGEWHLVDGKNDAVLTRPGQGAPEIEVCGRCHSRRTQISEDYVHGRPLSDTHRVQLLSEGLYYPDGQILDEVYVYGSFRQSRMHAAGVTCSDCHEPHSLKLRAQGNAVCTGCHATTSYDSPEHHHHPAGSSGSLCVECHMPSRDYMVVDPRRDHSMRIPRPDLSLALGVPNACSRCHLGRSDQWSLNALEAWYGKDRNPGYQRYAPVLNAAHEGGAGVAQGLSALALDQSAPVMARATALQEMGRFLEQGSLPAIQAGLKSTDPLMRRAAVETLQNVDATARLQLVAPLLNDPVRGVRLAAANVLADVRLQDVADPALRKALEKAFAEYLASERLNADRAEHWVNLAGFHFRQGALDEAEKDFAQARRRNARFVPTYVNQADMYRALGREDDGERILREGLQAVPEAASIHHALGLLLIRKGRQEEAMQSLEQAYRFGPEDPRLGYVYGIALENAGQRERAIEVWDAVVKRHPNDQEALNVLTMTLYQAGEYRRALSHAEHLAALSPDDQARQQVLNVIRQAAAGGR
ncbi:MAG: tetratricopeptide repeat protein [Sedimenticolaceae bacterium]